MVVRNTFIVARMADVVVRIQLTGDPRVEELARVSLIYYGHRYQTFAVATVTVTVSTDVLQVEYIILSEINNTNRKGKPNMEQEPRAPLVNGCTDVRNRPSCRRMRGLQRCNSTAVLLAAVLATVLDTVLASPELRFLFTALFLVVSSPPAALSSEEEGAIVALKMLMSVRQSEE